ncbi:unnamed protein product [Effrenium voratum]|uniref:Protein kinase domain-containing protein n=1 Tax=Effrenium voratum TaxID=2562239 RepID=A0AA36NC11_9DINO|nr:unnamed protein product [Effrenium voratum]|mmetsp:Transcript_1281/g.2967  ORF Transcript_1281/g.2967 Transcript_1281/m.2967 type:complete len:411 (-) Transcript_1281:26-1258(-)|eukprot:CAMPEP_0181443024 /NCGR_PEP_ID=MMETSP1110-20121109/24338_1 /TAXON_ID=174948 /ORGANISM="Symbiodinium sp., Strain CCMP421" /LENGTH=410 /DNA_ID=CAMNT_0023566983 /DNA_START=77 /DNA_END=1309 /DNA_ORIENTATION=-
MGCAASIARQRSLNDVSEAGRKSSKGTEATVATNETKGSIFRRVSLGSLGSLLSWRRKSQDVVGTQEVAPLEKEKGPPRTLEERIQAVDLTGILNNDADVAQLYFFSDFMLSKRTMVVIRLVTEKRTDELMACKQHNLRKSDRTSKHDRSPDMIKQQAIMLNECSSHPNIIRLQEAFVHNGYFYEILEYAAGGRLFDAILDAEYHTEQETANMVLQLLSGVQHMHDRKLCHRDIKPEHVLIKERSPAHSAEVKLCDFATACLFTPGESMTEKVTTPYYASPQVHEGLYTESVDVWSCGIVMYLLLTGYPRKTKAIAEHPNNYRGDDFLKALTKGKLHSLQERGDHISSQANHLLDQLLVTSEEHRATPRFAMKNAWLKHHAPQHAPSSPREGSAVSYVPGQCPDRAGLLF